MDDNREVDSADHAADAARLSRRRALKAGAALGVGVTAWAGPQIGRMGATPAYAAACTVPFTTVAFGSCKSTSCPDSCNSGTAKYISVGADSVSGTVNGGTVTAVVPATGTTASCAGPTARGQATLTVPNTTGQCRLFVEVYEGNNQCKNRDASALKGSAPTLAVLGGKSGNVSLPDVNCGSFAKSSNLFTLLSIQCTTSTDPNCF
jgi:hypothetical protein